MRNFQNRIAVVTGAASGIGRAMAERFAAEGMKVVLADIEHQALADTEKAMRTSGATVLAVHTDVGQAESVEELARKTLDTFGAVHVVCNNAGVGSPPGPIWERTVDDWEWVLAANLWSVIHGIRIFVPILLRQGDEGHIVNTASMAGLLSSPFLGIYNATKHAVVAMSETLHVELAMLGSKVKVSVLCPGFVQTRIGESNRNRPSQPREGPAVNPVETAIRQLIADGIPPSQVAARVMDAIRHEQLYILTHSDFKPALRTHMEDVLEERNPDAAQQSRLFTTRTASTI